MALFAEMKEFLANIRSGRRERPWWKIDCDEVGVHVSRYGTWKRSPAETLTSFRWVDVRAIHTFKRDHYIVDCVCLAFDLFGDRAVEVDEDMEGYAALVDQVVQRFPGFDKRKLADVVLPPFATNWTTLWRHDASEPWDDRHLAAALRVAFEAAMLSRDDVVGIIDREIKIQSSPAAWMLDASIASPPGQLRSVLVAAGEGHPMAQDELTWLDAAARSTLEGLDFARRVARSTNVFSDAGGEASWLLGDLEEAAFCAHETDGVPDPSTVAAVVTALKVKLKGNSRFAYALDRLEELGLATTKR